MRIRIEVGKSRGRLTQDQVLQHLDPSSHTDDDLPHLFGRTPSRRSKSTGFVDQAMYKFLITRVGKTWQQICDEFRAGLESSSGPNRRTLKELRSAVRMDCYEDGNIIKRNNKEQTRADGFYIHPRTRVLCYSQPESAGAVRKYARN